jgi:Na+-driven multidrug efflux pump
MMIALSRSFIFPVYFIFTLPFLLNTQGIFLAIPMAEAFTFILALFLFRKFSPRKIV